MSRKSQPPTYQRRKHKNGTVYARTKYLGEWISLGVADNPESIKRFRELEAQWDALQEAGGAKPRSDGLTVADLVADFMARKADGHYRHPDGRPTSELGEYERSAAPLLRLFGSKAAAKLGPLDLKAVRLAMVTGSWLTPAEKADREARGYEWTICRKTTNLRVSRIVRIWKWAVSEELVPAVTYQALTTVEGLQAGRTTARESEDIPPVSDQDLHDTLPLLAEPFRTLVLLQLAAGMRPGEVCAIRRDELDKIGVVIEGIRIWVIRPKHHKTRHHGVARQIALGPAAQALLVPWLEGNGEWLFPAGKKARKLGHVSTSGYDHAVLRACRRAGLPTWAPNRLRKSAATDTEDRFDLDTAKAALGHTSTATTKKFYAKGDLKKAARAARKLG